MEATENTDGYTVGHWGEFPKYECASCRYDTLELPDIKRHVYDEHVKPTLSSPGVLIYDADGNPIPQAAGLEDSEE